MRLDLYLVESGRFHSRAKAQAAISEGDVWLDGVPVFKNSLEVDESSHLKVMSKNRYVGRAGDKLAAFLPQTNIDIENKNCADIGSSTGGFTQVLLENGAARVTAVDVGKNQLHESLRQNPKILLFEQTNVQDFIPPFEIDVLTCDVSFVSTTSLLEVFDKIGFLYAIILFKPQYEVGKDAKRTKKGVLKDSAPIARAIRAFETKATALGWKLLLTLPSAVKGKEGNEEIFYAFKRD
jgi:23S rRNA (cytidine1920-2'-O)/16S rRNA (cytidine1409-2'-O)-methyltransferase